MLAGDVAVMTSPKADVSRCRSSTWKRVKNTVGMWKHVEARGKRPSMRGTRELEPRIFRWCVRARSVFDGFEASTNV